MKIQKLAAMAKKEKLLDLYSGGPGRCQWLGLSRAMYALDGLPLLEPSTLCAVLDIPPQTAADHQIQELAFPEGLGLDGERGQELTYDRDRLITFNGYDLMPLRGSGGVMVELLSPGYLAPLDIPPNLLSLQARQTDDGMTYIVAMDGMFPVAVFWPHRPSGDLASWLGDVYSLAHDLAAGKGGRK